MRKYILMVLLLGGVVIVMACFNSRPLDVNRAILAQANRSNETASNSTPHEQLDPYRLTIVPSELTIDGGIALPLAKAIEAFKSEKRIPIEKKKFGNYKLELRQDEKVFMVSILVKRDPKTIYVGGETENGIDVTYVISKENGEITASVFYK